MTRKKSRLEIEEQEAETVRLIFELYASGKGYKAIVNRLNTKGYKTKLDNQFSVAQLRTILTNPVYLGKVRFNIRRDWNEKRRHNINPNPIIVDGIHEAIIEEELLFLERKNDLNEQLEQVKHRTNETALTLITEEKKEIPVDTIRSILRDFGKILSSDIDRTVQKRLLHMLISEITINKSRNIDSIKLKLTDELIRFLQNNGGTPTDGMPSVFMFRELGIKTLELELVI